MTTIGGSGISDHYGEGGGGGASDASDLVFTPYEDITATNAQDAIEQVYDLIPVVTLPTASEVSFTPTGALTGDDVQEAMVQLLGLIPDTTRYNWTFSSSVAIDAVTAVDLTGIPTDVNEVYLSLAVGNNGASPGNILLQFLNQGGSVINTSYLQGGMKTTFGGVVELQGGSTGFQIAKDFDPTYVYRFLARFVREGVGNSWSIHFSGFGYVPAANTEHYLTGSGVRVVTGGLGGLRISTSAGQFANGSAVMAWRK